MKQTELKLHKSRHCNIKNNCSMPPEMVKIQPTVWGKKQSLSAFELPKPYKRCDHQTE